MDKFIPITAVVGDRNYRVKINPDDEQKVRSVLKLLNEKIIEFKTQYAGKDMQDYISMVLLWFATEKNTNYAADNVLETSLTDIENLLNRHKV